MGMFVKWDHHLRSSVKAKQHAIAHHVKVARIHNKTRQAKAHAWRVLKHARHVRAVWAKRAHHARGMLHRAHKAYVKSVHHMKKAAHAHAHMKKNLIKAIHHAKATHHAMVKAHHKHAHAKRTHIKAHHAMKKAGAHRRHMLKLRKIAAARHAHAKKHFIKALKALKRSKKAAIKANRKVHAHAIKGMKAGHV